MDLRKEIYFYANLAAFPATGALNCLYVASATGIIYTWNGSSYVASGPGPVPTGLNYQGLWDANANLPLITSSVGTVGNYYIVGTAGTTNINGINDWGVGDWIVFSSTGVWQKIDNSDLEGYNLIQDEGTALPQRTVIDFQGGGVTASDDPINSKTIVSIVAASGRFGIANTNGVYTYYADLTSALTAAVAGQTIEFFSDITINTATTYTLKDGVNINGNGHTLTNTNNTTAFNVFTDGGGSVSCNVQNLKIVRSGSVNQGNTFDLTGTGNFDFSGSQVIRLSNSDAGICIRISNTVTVNNLYATSDRGQVYSCLSGSASFIGCYFRQVSGSTTCGATQGTMLNCYIQANTTTALSMSGASYASNCLIISGTGQALSMSGGEIVNCSCISTTNYGVNMTGGEVINCHIKSNSQNALYMQGGVVTQCRIFTASAGSVNGNANVVRLYQSDIYCQWNDVNGHGIQRGLDVHQNRVRVSNLTAKCLFSSAAANVAYSQNNFTGPATYANPVSVTITQTIVNTEDGQGNLLV